MRAWFAVFNLAFILSQIANAAAAIPNVQANLRNNLGDYPPPQATETLTPSSFQTEPPTPVSQEETITPSNNATESPIPTGTSTEIAQNADNTTETPIPLTNSGEEPPPYKIFLPLIVNPTYIYLPIIIKPDLTPAITLNYHSGQTFITWKERLDLQNELYRVYRSSVPIDASNLSQAAFLGQVGRDSARFYANRFLNITNSTWQDRFTDRLIIKNFGDPLPEGTGLMVWTLSSQDFGGASSGNGYYAVTVTPAGGSEILYANYTAGPVAEAVADPDPVEIHSSTSIEISPFAHIFIQYMDLRSWNATFHAPNATNDYYGISPAAPGVSSNLQYAYDYEVVLPDPAWCGGSLPAQLPVVISLHGRRGNVYYNSATDPYPDYYCAYIILPQDESDTWYFGFARNNDYRLGSVVASGDTIVNYTEQRVLRMLYDLIRHPIGPAVDQQRVYVVGQSMGGSGALAFAERYPNVFAAAYASQPMSDPATANTSSMDWVALLSQRWGVPALDLPVLITAPNHWADPIKKYSGIGVWRWQNYRASASGSLDSARKYDDMAPVGVIFGTGDTVIPWSTQGAPTFQAFNTGLRAWGGMVNEQTHLWQYYRGLPPDLAPYPYSNKSNIYTWVPFWNLKVIKNETIPALSNLSGNSSAAPGGYYNQTILWSSSWNDWNGSPVDLPTKWQISFCSVALWSTSCGSGPEYQTVDVTPRRLQQFVVKPGATYDWTNMMLHTNSIVQYGTVTADSKGLLTIPGFRIYDYEEGNLLTITPHSP